MKTPVATRLQCLSCGSTWWSETERPKRCPRCRPTRDESTSPPTTTIHVAIALMQEEEP